MTSRIANSSLALVVAGALAACGSDAEPAASRAAASVTPVFVAGNPTCQDLGFLHEFKVDPPNAGTYIILGDKTVTVTTDGIFFDWTSEIGIDAVIAKGGPNANVYVYDPPPPEAFADTGLVSPTNPSNGQPFGLSHISFCYDIELEVTKTASPSFKRTWEWTIEKVADKDELTLMAGQVFQSVKYEVTVDPSSTDSDWAVEGTITIHNPAPDLSATIASVTDVVSPDLAATVDCGVTFPYVLAAGGTLECTYETALPDGADRTNTATVAVTAQSAVKGGSGTAEVDFEQATVTEIDECVDVEDTLEGPLGQACGESQTFTYYRDIGPYEACGTFDVDNTASFETNDTGATGSDSWKIVVSIVDCDAGCTLTQGYWKTHSENGPAPYDDAWLVIGALGAGEPFFDSGKTYYQVLWTPPAGNAYYNLAHQYIAAKLNLLNGASSTAAVDAAIAYAETFFATYAPGNWPKNQKNTLLGYATTLDQYNNGLIGPGHCDE